ncbi:MAG TPA: MarR family winged helix-turn-helix transcriptional regulator [Afifellaceae bacterium]|nr:MarR family winged helix-turn-helix transcriptional regulator [Afifellaceae bacterium]
MDAKPYQVTRQAEKPPCSDQDGDPHTVVRRLIQAAKAHRARAAMQLSQIGLYPGQDGVLALLGRRDGLTMGEVADALAIQPPTVTKMVSRLSAAGLVERRAVEGDQRKASVHLTPSGRSKLEQIDVIWQELEENALTGIETDRRRRLSALLAAIEQNLTRGLRHNA